MEFDPEFTHIRRQDRRVDDEAWIVAFLQRAAFGVLATSVQDQPFVNINLFAYDPERRAVYLHHASRGRTMENLRRNRRVCFTAAEMGRLLPAAQAREFSLEYASVVIFGQANVVEEQDEMLYGLRLLMAKYAPHLQPGVDYPVIREEELVGVAVIRIDVADWSAKRKQVAADFPGAYRWEQVIKGNFNGEIS
ncbi:MAG: pyridoxamine 5'-phosphate oxidase family protein [Anaerolineales bacterium]|nr:pyridoxamine 5'-phosphate oxidase family protein [Anaerolineales bacterium]